MLQDCRILASPAHPSPSPGSTDTAREPALPSGLSNTSFLWTFSTQLPPGITCAKERASPSLCSRISLVVQQVWLFKSNSWGTACPLLLAAHSLQSRVIIWGSGWYQGASSFPPCLCRLDTHTTVTTASLKQDIPFSAFKFNSPSKAGSSDELTAAEEGTFFCLLGL